MFRLTDLIRDVKADACRERMQIQIFFCTRLQIQKKVLFGAENG
jgi:hypothetical protein